MIANDCALESVLCSSGDQNTPLNVFIYFYLFLLIKWVHFESFKYVKKKRKRKWRFGKFPNIIQISRLNQ